MDIASFCPLKATSVVWQAHTGAYAFTVIVKATFLLKPGQAVLAPEQDPIHEGERFWGDDPRRAVRAPSDRAPYKPRAEVMLVGHAYAPGRQPVRSLVATMIVGELDKSIEVVCDRGFRLQEGQLLEGARFTQAPIGWEKAAGGAETNNPVGISFDGPPNTYGMVTIPNVQPVGTYLAQQSDRFAPIGFGPIGARWPSRAQKLGRYAVSFREPGWEQSPMPADFDSRFFLSAPPDQQVAAIRPDERIILENLHPEHARLVTALPGLRPRAIADRATGEREEVQLVADTLWIDTDRGLCCVVWRGRIGLRNAAEAGRVAVWVDGMPMVAPKEERARGEEKPVVEEDDGSATMTLLGPMLKKGEPALPFVAGESGLLVHSNAETAAHIAQWAAVSGDFGDGSGTMFAPLSAPAKAVLPFGARGEEHEDLAETIPPVPKAGVTPFMPAMPPLQPLRFEEVPAIGYVEPAAVVRETVGDTDAPKGEVAPPAMVGPIAVAAEKLAEKGGGPQAETEVAAAEAVVEEEVVELSIEETARIAAEIAEGKEERGKVLEAHELTERAWAKNEERWEAAMEEEDEHGKSEFGARYDAAYVKRVEEFRGTIMADDYAKLVVGMERGREEAVLKELRIQEEALMPIMRIWAKKVAGDMKLAKKVTEALRGGRAA